MSYKLQKAINARFNVVQGQSYVVQRNTVYELDEVGCRIWELCDGSNTVEDIATKLTQEYTVPYEEVLRDCEEFVADLQSKGLLE